MNETFRALFIAVMFVFAIIGGVFLIAPAHNTTAEVWQRGETACEANGGVKHALRYVHYLEVACVNGALFTIKTEIDE